MSHSYTEFIPTQDCAQRQLNVVDPVAYARTRNMLEGAVTRLSPYITHGFLTLPEILLAVHSREPVTIQHKFVYELAWREYFHHVWTRAGDAIFDSLHEGPLPDSVYLRELPTDIREARTGVPAIDQAVRGLYENGYVHNHARMWLASYIVHVRRVHWRAGADWLYAHLIDGDLASNHLSWQWVAGTGSSKPYLFNAENVAKYAPQSWRSEGSAIDLSYDALDTIARGGKTPAVRAHAAGLHEPDLLHMPPSEFMFAAPNPEIVVGRLVYLIHPWSLGAISKPLPADAVIVAIIDTDFHKRWAWNSSRWRFVCERMAALTPHRWVGDSASLYAVLASAKVVHGRDDPHLSDPLRLPTLSPPARLFESPKMRCHSFSKFWTKATGNVSSIDSLLHGVNGSNSDR